MEKFRVIVSHDVKEKIVLDVEAPDRETLDAMANDIHAHACELPGWKFGWDGGVEREYMEVIEHAERYDMPPDGVLKINEQGEVEDIEFPDTKLNAAESKALRIKIEKALNRSLSCCLDDARDRERVITALMEELG